MRSVTNYNLLRFLVTIVATGMLCTGCSESLPPPDKSPLTETEKQARLFAVVRAGDFVVAVSSNGFYRTQASTKNWERISVPRGMWVQGQFATSQSDSNSIFYWPYSFGKSGGLYVSHDAGSKWDLVSGKFGFRFVYPNHDGRLYAIVEKEVTIDSRKGFRSRLLLSNNQGKSWKDISQNIFGDLESIFTDPQHTNRVCVLGNSIRGYIFESVDDNYSEWTNTVEWNWRKDSKTDEEFLEGGYSTGNILYMLNARLSNYFDYDFGSAAQIPAFEISVQTNHLVFGKEDQIEIPVTIKFREPGFTVKLPDATNGEEMWSIQMITPLGERIRSQAKTNRIGQARTEILRQQYRALPDFKIAEVSATNSYSRMIDLSHLSDFSNLGEYRFRLCYSSSGWAWEQGEHEGHGIKTDIWDGSFCSPIFTLTIKP
jgi:hypothetical protein